MGEVEDEKDTIEGRVASLRGRRVGMPHRSSPRHNPPAYSLLQDYSTTKDGLEREIREKYANNYVLAAIDTINRMGFDVEDAGDQIKELGLGPYINRILSEAAGKLTAKETEGEDTADCRMRIDRLRLMRDWYFNKLTPPEGFPTPAKQGILLTRRVDTYKGPANSQ